MMTVEETFKLLIPFLWKMATNLLGKVRRIENKTLPDRRKNIKLNLQDKY